MSEERFTVGTVVVTTRDAGASDWSAGARDYVRWGVSGVIVAVHDSHGLFYDVKHADDSRAPYEHAELEAVAPAPHAPALDPTDWRLQAASHLRIMADEFEAGRGHGVLAVTLIEGRTIHYRGCNNHFDGAMVVTRTLDVLDQLRGLINGSISPLPVQSTGGHGGNGN